MVESISEIDASPRSYYAWLQCLEIMKQRRLSDEEKRLIGEGEWTDASSASFLEESVIDTVNAVLHRETRWFHRDMEMYGTDTEEMYMLFVMLSRRLRELLFFETMTFLRADFRKELTESVKNETMTYWNGLIRSLQRSCMESGDGRLEDLVFMLRRHAPFTMNKD